MIYALSHDETLSLYQVDGDGNREETKDVVLGDIRPKANCEYVVDVQAVSGQALVIVGSHRQVSQASFRHASAHSTSSQQRTDIIPLDPTRAWDLNNNEAVQLVGAHGEEIVRTVHIDRQVSGGQLSAKLVCAALLNLPVWDHLYGRRGRSD